MNEKAIDIILEDIQKNVNLNRQNLVTVATTSKIQQNIKMTAMDIGKNLGHITHKERNLKASICNLNKFTN